MKLQKLTIYRLVADTLCGCQVSREYSDSTFKAPVADADFLPCHKHKTGEVADVIQMMLQDYLTSEAEKEALRPVIVRNTTGAATSVIGDDNVTPFNRPVNVRPRQADPTKVKVFNRNQPAGTAKAAAKMDVEEGGGEGYSIDSQLAGAVDADPRIDNLVENTIELALEGIDLED